MNRVLLVSMIVATIPFLIYSGMRRRLRHALSVTATVYLVVYGLRALTGVWFFSEEMHDTIGLIAFIVLVAGVLYTVIRYYGDRAVQRKLADRTKQPDAHRSLIHNLLRSRKNRRDARSRE